MSMIRAVEGSSLHLPLDDDDLGPCIRPRPVLRHTAPLALEEQACGSYTASHRRAALTRRVTDLSQLTNCAVEFV